MFQDYTDISDLEHCMALVSVVITQYLHVEMLIDSVKVRFEDIVKIYLACTIHRHH